MRELIEQLRKTADSLPPLYPEKPHPLYGLLHHAAHGIARLEAKNARAESEIEQLRAALRPFVTAPLTQDGYILGLMREDFDRAKLALADVNP